MSLENDRVTSNFLYIVKNTESLVFDSNTHFCIIIFLRDNLRQMQYAFSYFRCYPVFFCRYLMYLARHFQHTIENLCKWLFFISVFLWVLVGKFFSSFASLMVYIEILFWISNYRFHSFFDCFCFFFRIFSDISPFLAKNKSQRPKRTKKKKLKSSMLNVTADRRHKRDVSEVSRMNSSPPLLLRAVVVFFILVLPIETCLPKHIFQR